MWVTRPCTARKPSMLLDHDAQKFLLAGTDKIFTRFRKIDLPLYIVHADTVNLDTALLDEPFRLATGRRKCQIHEQRRETLWSASRQHTPRRFVRGLTLAEDAAKFIGCLFCGFLALKAGYHRVSQLHLRLHGVQQARAHFLPETYDHRRRKIRQQLIIRP